MEDITDLIGTVRDDLRFLIAVAMKHDQVVLADRLRDVIVDLDGATGEAGLLDVILASATGIAATVELEQTLTGG